MAGFGNTVTGPFASIPGGLFNNASGKPSVGQRRLPNNNANGLVASVSGGEINTAEGFGRVDRRRLREHRQQRGRPSAAARSTTPPAKRRR